MEIRQSLKAVKAGYALCVLLELVIVVMWYQQVFPASIPLSALALLPLILAIFVVIRHIQRRMTKITISNDRVHYEQGLLSKTTRTVELAKVQDVRVHQTLWQRLFDIGNLSLETAGSTSRIVIDSIDRVLEVSNHISDMVRAAGKAAPMGPIGGPQIGQGQAKVNELEQGS
jgi:membrane protein YdbS with pleckstrin-like domain